VDTRGSTVIFETSINEHIPVQENAAKMLKTDIINETREKIKKISAQKRWDEDFQSNIQWFKR